jgi:MFS family permease
VRQLEKLAGKEAQTDFRFSRLSVQTVFWQLQAPDLLVTFDQLTNALAINYAGTATGSIFFVPFAIKYGRRPVYLVSTAIMAGLAFWTAHMHSLTELYITSLLCGLAGSTNETIVQMTVRVLCPIEAIRSILHESNSNRFRTCFLFTNTACITVFI